MCELQLRQMCLSLMTTLAPLVRMILFILTITCRCPHFSAYAQALRLSAPSSPHWVQWWFLSEAWTWLQRQRQGVDKSQASLSATCPPLFAQAPHIPHSRSPTSHFSPHTPTHMYLQMVPSFGTHAAAGGVPALRPQPLQEHPHIPGPPEGTSAWLGQQEHGEKQV